MEQVNLAAPATTPQTTRWIVQETRLTVGARFAGDGTIEIDGNLSEIFVHLLGDQHQVKTHSWKGNAAHTDIVALNKANLSTKSLQKRIMEKLIADGVVEGTIAGTPD